MGSIDRNTLLSLHQVRILQTVAAAATSVLFFSFIAAPLLNGCSCGPAACLTNVSEAKRPLSSPLEEQLRLLSIEDDINEEDEPNNRKERPPSRRKKLRYTYGAKFEPPEGRIIHGMGQFPDGNKVYTEMLNDKALYPATRLFFISLADQDRPWSMRLKIVINEIRRATDSGMIPHISIALRDKESKQQDINTIDRIVVESDKYDSRIQDLIDFVMWFGGPVFVRIGGEFNGNWNGFTPFYLPRDFRKFVKMFRSSGADNAAFVWCYMPVAEDDFDERNRSGEYKWFPGDDVIDWFGIDLFAVNQFHSDPSYLRSERKARRTTHSDKTLSFLKMAKRYKKPVIVAESSAARINITADPKKASGYWKTYFEPFFEFIRGTPQIKAYHYINPPAGEERLENFKVGLNHTLFPSCPGLSRASTNFIEKSEYCRSKDVDGRNKSGHDAVASDHNQI